MAHITGGGITDNLPRMLPSGTHAAIDRSAWQTPAIFQWLQQAGGVPDADMLRTFNMGIGLIIACAPDRERELIDGLAGDRRARGRSHRTDSRRWRGRRV